MTTARKLKELREQKGLSQADCAKALGIDRTTYAKYENGGSIRRNVAKLASYFNVTTDYLLGRSDYPHGEPFAGQRESDFMFQEQIFAKRLKELRQKESNLSQASLAEIMGTSLQDVEQWEAAHHMPADETLSKLAAYFNTSTDYLEGKDILDESNNAATPGSTPGASSNTIESIQSLSPNERILIKNYRCLSDTGKQSIDMHIESLREALLNSVKE